MKNVNVKVFIWVILLTAFPIWFLFASFMKIKFGFTWEAFKMIPNVVTFEILLWLVFAKWAWKLKIFQGWLVKFPILEGKWLGEIKTTWSPPNGDVITTPIQAELVIKQSFIRMSCIMKTNEMSSQSFSTEFLEDPDSDVIKLVYSYINIPKAGVRDKSNIHYGTVLLEVITAPQKMLQGIYWTDRKTTGDINFKYIGKN